MGKSRIKPEDPFPEDLNLLEDNQVEILNSKVHRQLEVEYVQNGSPDPETEHRQEEVNEELDDRDLLSEARTQHVGRQSRANDDAGSPPVPEGSVPEASPERNPGRR